MIGPNKTQSCYIGLTQSDLQAILTLLNCGHDQWLQKISSNGQEILKRPDVVMTLISDDGIWWYRTRDELSIRKHEGHSDDCISIKEMIDETSVFPELAASFEDRTYTTESFNRVLHHIRKSSLLDKTKEALEVVLGNELRYTMGPQIIDMLEGKGGSSIAEIVQKSMQLENSRIRIIAAATAPPLKQPGYKTALAQVLVDASKWHQSFEDPNISALRVAPGVTGYVKILPEKTRLLGVAGNKQWLTDLVNNKQLELYCGIGSEKNIFRLEPADFADHWSAHMDMIGDLKW